MWVQTSSPHQRNTDRLIETGAYRLALYERRCREDALAEPPSSRQRPSRSNPRNGVALCNPAGSKSLRAEAMERLTAAQAVELATRNRR